MARTAAESLPPAPVEIPPLPLPTPAPQPPPAGKPTKSSSKPPTPAKRELAPPSTGVEIVGSEDRKGTIYHTVRDLRNNNHIKNVTRSSARKLWHYAITQVEAGLPDPKNIQWHGDIAIIDKRQKDEHTWYDLAMRTGDQIRVFFGVTDSGLNDDWLALIEQSD